MVTKLEIKPFNYEAFGSSISGADVHGLDALEYQTPFVPLTQDEEEEEEIGYSEAELVAAREEGRKAGYEEGVAQVDRDKQQQDQQLAILLDGVGQRLGQFFASNDETLQKVSDGSVKLAVEVARKVSDKALQENPTANVEEMVRKCMGLIATEPKIIVTVNEALLETLQGRLFAIAQEKGFAGKVEMRANAEMAAHDCRLEWQNGGAEINTEEKWQKIREALGVSEIVVEEKIEEIAESSEEKAEIKEHGEEKIEGNVPNQDDTTDN